MDDESWGAWSKLVVHTMEENRDEHRDIWDKIETLDTRLNACIDAHNRVERENAVGVARLEGKESKTSPAWLDSRIGLIIGAIMDFIFKHLN